ncbi:unnamed protein product [Enterobius vermicularis]|uniref:Sel1 repeat family protein n=1 Tax=Enterobius vermicularis TaxID=51028 RepID=A0A0N4V4L1_ENTVE|nr:unnamed protein product [Enterobius vermicularis]
MWVFPCEGSGAIASSWSWEWIIAFIFFGLVQLVVNSSSRRDEMIASLLYFLEVEGLHWLVNVEKVSFLKRDPELALKYGLIACNLGVPQACANVSRMYSIGDGVEKNEEKAAEYKDKALKLAGMKQKKEGFLRF